MPDPVNMGGIPAHLMHETEVSKAKSAFGKEDFMKLLMTQLQNQDPLNPMDHREFSAQLAQFSSLEQLTNIGAGIQSLKGEMGEDSKLQALGFIGKSVQATGGEIDFRENVGARVLNASSVEPPSRALIVDAQGSVLREIRNDGKSRELIWDGKDGNGKEVALGKYHYRLFRNLPDGQEKEMSAEVSGKVTGVDLEGRTPVLLVSTAGGNQRLELSKVRSVEVEGEAKPSSKDPRDSTPGPKLVDSKGLEPKQSVAVEKPDLEGDSELEFPQPTHGWNLF